MMIKILTTAGIKPVIADGGFCLLGDWTPLKHMVPKARTAMDFIVWMIKEVGVLGWPLSMFYGDEHKYMAQDYIRFCYHKV